MVACEDDVASGSAETAYWTAIVLAGLIAAMALADAIYGIYMGQPEIPFVALFVAGAIWLIGSLFRYLGRR
jgi:hypothetical protein